MISIHRSSPAKAALAGLALLALTGSSAAAADAKGSPPRQCFFTREVRSFTAVNDSRVNFLIGASDVYQVDLFGPCHDVSFALGLALESRVSGSICSPLDAEVVVNGPSGPQRCPVSAIRKLTPDEVAALPRKQRP